MTLPAADDYQRALLHPALCFRDPVLAQGRARLSTFGLPVAWSGQFATVFRLDTPSGAQAVRCFTGRLADQKERYAALQAHLRRRTLPLLARFDFLADGILVGPDRHPIVRMEWVDGVPLDRAVEQAVAARDGATLRALADAVVEMAGTLEGAGLAHGDLQHENILVYGTRLRLVDYDGVWLAALGGRGALESGHPHYRHPRRGGADPKSDFGPHIDRFPALVLALSLRALAVDTALWHRYHSDKHLVLRREDYAAPDRSALLVDLTRSPDATVRRLALGLAQACGLPPDKTPDVRGLYVDPAAAPSQTGKSKAAAAKPAQVKAAVPVTVASNDWRASWRAPEASDGAARNLISQPGLQSERGSKSTTVLPLSRLRASWGVMYLPPVAAWWPRIESFVARVPGSDALAAGVLAAWNGVRRAPAVPPLAPPVAALTTLAAGGSAGILLAWLHVVGAPSWPAMAVVASLLPLLAVTTRRGVAAAAAHLLMALTAAALALGLSAGGTAGALAGTLAGLLLFRRAEEEIGLGRMAVAALAALLPLAAASLLAGGTAPAAALVGMAAAALMALSAAPVSLIAGRLLRRMLAALAGGQIGRV